MSVFFISDTHLGHGNIMKYVKRPQLRSHEMDRVKAGDEDFRVCDESIKQMDDEIIDAINATVAPDDTLFHLGDFAWRNHREYRDRIRCRNIVLVIGNHDESEDWRGGDLFARIDDEAVRACFPRIYDQVAVKVGRQKIVLNHYPMMTWHHGYKGVWHLFGHVHGALARDPDYRRVWEKQNSLDVGVDGPWTQASPGDTPMADHRFRPWSMAEIAEFMSYKKRASLI